MFPPNEAAKNYAHVFLQTYLDYPEVQPIYKEIINLSPNSNVYENPDICFNYL